MPLRARGSCGVVIHVLITHEGRECGKNAKKKTPNTGLLHHEDRGERKPSRKTGLCGWDKFEGGKLESGAGAELAAFVFSRALAFRFCSLGAQSKVNSRDARDARGQRLKAKNR
jgi:hypothetical protein